MRGKRGLVSEATAEVVAVRSWVPRARRLGCTLDMVVAPPGRRQFRATARKLAVDMALIPKRGDTIPVMVDARDRSRVRVRWDDLRDRPAASDAEVHALDEDDFAAELAVLFSRRSGADVEDGQA